MKKIGIIIAVVFIGLTIVSFTTMHTSGKLKVTPGIYGVCNCENSETRSEKVELTIHEDFTFQYYDNSNPAKIIDIKGNWTEEGNTIFLKDYSSVNSIHNKWEVEKNGTCVRSRKGLEFVRLCKIAACK